MKISLADYREIMDYMVAERWQGMEYVAFSVNSGPVRKHDLSTFIDRREAKEFCHHNSTGSDFYGCLATRSVYRCMQEALIDSSLLVENNGIVDISAMIDRYHLKLENREKENQNLETIKQKEDVMNEKNVEYLANEMFYTGFGEIQRSALMDKIKEGNEEFQLVHDRKFGNDTVRARLNFKESEKNPGMYFYNSFDVMLKKAGKEETIQQNFSASYGNRYKLKEAYNLLDGRGVNKDFIRFDRDDRENKQEYNAWVHLDFKDTDDNGNFKIIKNYDYNLEKQLEGYPIKGLEDEETKNKLMDSLKRGDIEQVIINTSRGEEKMNIEAAPRFDSLNFYDEKMKPVKLSTKGIVEGQAMENGQAKSQDVSGDTKADMKQKSQSAKNEPEGGKSETNSTKKAAKPRVRV